MLKVLRTMATAAAAGLLLAVTPATAHAARGTDGALSDVTDLVGTPLNAGLFG